MLDKYKNHHKDVDRYNEIVKGLSQFSWDDANNNEAYAKSYLNKFFNLYFRCPAQDNDSLCNNYYSYIPQLLLFRKALIDKKYGRACHELYDICVLEPIFQSRIRISLLEIYKKYME